MQSGLRAKIVLLAVGIATLSVAAITFTAAWTFSTAYSQAIAERSSAISHDLATQFERLLALGLQPEEIIGFDDQCDKVKQDHEGLAHVAVLAPDGRLIFQSQAPNTSAYIDNQDLKSAAASARPAQISTHINGNAVLATLTPVFNPARLQMGSVLIAHSQAAIDQKLNRLYLGLGGVGILFLGLSGSLLFWAISRFVTTPLGQVVSAIDLMRKQAPIVHKRITVEAEAELDVLIDGFNSLLKHLEQHQHELVLAREAAEAANRAKSEFLATVSHELRTPLNGILGMNALLLRTELTSKQKRYASVVEESGQNLLAIIEEILDFISMESGGLSLERQPIHLKDLIENVKNSVEALAMEKGLVLTSEVQSPCPDTLWGDNKRLQQILTNLVGNAIKFTEQGQVSITARALEAPYVELEVTDSGIGIAPEMQDLIFQPFRQADGSYSRRYGGTGLGLAITKRLVEAMGGQISLDSEPGRGTVFKVRLPLISSGSETDKPVQPL
ncbi:MAG: ATP-binding protein [Pseudomonadota bacterium]